jgi:hypothetical protein
MRTRTLMIGIALLAVALVVGGVYVVLRPETVRAEGGRFGRTGAGVGTVQTQGCTGNCGEVGTQGRWSQANGADTQTGTGHGRMGQDAMSPASGRAATAVIWQTIEGKVIEVSAETGTDFTVQLADGTTAEVGGGPSFYWEAQGYKVSSGENMRVRGFVEEGEFKAGTVENLTSGQTIALRDETGRPLWAGRGMGRGR